MLAIAPHTPTPDVRPHHRTLDALVALTTHAAMGGAVRLSSGGLRRDWLVFGSSASTRPRSATLEQTAQHLRCDLIVAEWSDSDVPACLHAGVRLWGRFLWHPPMRLWRDDTGGRCCLAAREDDSRHLWLDTGRIVACNGAPWRGGHDRDLGFARADAALRRLVRVG